MYVCRGLGPVVAMRSSQGSSVVGEVVKFSAHSLINDALYLPCSILNAWGTCPWKCGGGQAGGGGAGGGGLVQGTTNTEAPRVGPWVELHNRESECI